MSAFSYHIRDFEPKDVSAVGEILRHSPEAAHWSSEALLGFAGDNATGQRIFQVLESHGRVSGFLMARVAADEAEILNLAILPPERRLGQGGALLSNCLALFRTAHVGSIFLEVRESNSAAIGFYKKHGFFINARRIAYYLDPEEAALCMVRKLTEFQD